MMLTPTHSDSIYSSVNGRGGGESYCNGVIAAHSGPASILNPQGRTDEHTGEIFNKRGGPLRQLQRVDDRE